MHTYTYRSQKQLTNVLSKFLNLLFTKSRNRGGSSLSINILLNKKINKLSNILKIDTTYNISQFNCIDCEKETYLVEDCFYGYFPEDVGSFNFISYCSKDCYDNINN